MLNVRVEGDPHEAMAYVEHMRGTGVEVQIGTAKDRGINTQVYTVARMPWYEPPADPGPVRVQATVERRPVSGRGRRQLRGRQ
jgi:hypothetical protein